MLNLELWDVRDGLVPDSTFFCLDEERNIIVGAVNIRHHLNGSLLLNGVRTFKRRNGLLLK